MKIAVVGGGLSGLVAAYDLTVAGHRVAVYEGSNRWGGKIFSSPVGDRSIDAGPDNFLARVPDATALCVELGLEDQLTVPVAPKPAYIYINGSLAPLPAGTVLGVPTDFDALAGVISPAGIERAKQDLTLPATSLDQTTSVADYCRARLGDEVTDTLIDPMVGGINASSIERLSMADGASQLFAAARRGPSIIEGLREARASVGATLGSAGKDQPVFHGLNGGMATLIDRLVRELTRLGAHLQLNTPVSALPRDVDHVIVATQAHAAATLLATESPDAAQLVGAINHASVAQLTVEFPSDQLTPLDASGILVPRPAGLVMTACTWFSTKWGQYARSGSSLVRITSGRYGDLRASQMDDNDLANTLLADFAHVYAHPGVPLARRIVRWPDAFPQYEPGHGQRVDQAVDALAVDAPHIHLVGNSYRGIGIPATIKLARQTVAAIIA